VRDPVLGCISLFLLIGLSGQLRQNRMAWRFRKIVRDEDLEHSDDVLIPAIFRMLKQEPYSKLPLAIKYRAANDLLEGIGNEPPTFWPTILSLLLYALVICMPVLFALCYFLFFRSSGPV
jgi:hypothetical protein